MPRPQDVSTEPQRLQDADLPAATTMGEGVHKSPGSGKSYVGQDLAGRNFTGQDLRGADFSRADLSGAMFLGADLRGAIFFEANAEGAEFATANLEGAILRQGRFDRAGFGSAHLADVEATRAQLEGASLIGADLRGAILVGAQMNGTRWSEADLRGTDLRRATLTNADLTSVQVGGANFDDVDLSGSKLSRVAGFRKASWLGVDATALDRRGARFVYDTIQDQNYIAEFRSQGRGYEWTYRLWWLTSDCGRSSTRWAMCSGGIAVFFALIYTFVTIDYGDYQTPLSPLYFSLVTLTTLGYGDALPATMAAQAVVMVEVVVGYVMLGGLLSLISNKLSRKGS